ncbi:MAG: GNAT family N-acetyltransferase [Candidatus Bathyarchaeota archaeon]|nr:MAG: GNAT family N-acetyltransferase [Candidatus Bathyarchaeota archaeon]
MNDLVIRQMTEDDEGFFLELISLTGWGNTAEDLRRILYYEPRGCFVAVLDDVDTGMVASTGYGEVGWIGNLVVLTERRGGGVGAMLMRRAMRHLLDSGASSIRLDAVEKAIPLYERLGFRVEFESLRFTGTGEPAQVEGIEAMKASDLGEVVELDRRFFGAPRERMLIRVQGDFPGLCFVARESSRIVGFIMAKPSDVSVRIGPWICDPGRPDLAEALLRRLMGEATGEKLWVGVPEKNRASVRILRDNGFGSLPTSLRMCYGRCEPMGEVAGRFSIGAADKG